MMTGQVPHTDKDVSCHASQCCSAETSSSESGLNTSPFADNNIGCDRGGLPPQSPMLLGSSFCDSQSFEGDSSSGQRIAATQISNHHCVDNVKPEDSNKLCKDSSSNLPPAGRKGSLAATWEYDQVTGDGGVPLNFDTLIESTNLARLNEFLQREESAERMQEEVQAEEDYEVHATVMAAAVRRGLATKEDATEFKGMAEANIRKTQRRFSSIKWQSGTQQAIPGDPMDDRWTYSGVPSSSYKNICKSISAASENPKVPKLPIIPLGNHNKKEKSSAAHPSHQHRTEPGSLPSAKADLMSSKNDLAIAIRNQLKAQMHATPDITDESNRASPADPKEDLKKTIHVNFIDGQIKPLHIVMLVTGTRGDVQPFIGIGLKLKEFGHRVRIASHKIYRSFVEDFGLEFYPIGGDPKVLSEYVVKHRGIMPGWNLNDAWKQREQVKEILYSSWGACVEPDPENQDKPFVADAIVANPPAYGHSHCAEKLNCPLHILFTMPWTPTRCFPSPFARIKTVLNDTNSTARAVMNWLSYFAMEDLAWLGMAGMVKDFRQRVLGLKNWSKEHMSHALYHSKVPMTYMWSPSLVGRPHDWPSHCEVAGFINLEVNKLTNYQPPQDLAGFLKAGPPPVYIGFGSLVLNDPGKITQQFLDALAATGLRAVIQKGWGGLGVGVQSVPENVFLLEGNCAHDWLFHQCCAVVHHGGAGTTATGLLAGKPTFIVYFFGDQPFWGAACNNAGVGPAPVAIDHVTAPKIVDALKELILPSKQRAAERMSVLMNGEDGISKTVDHLHRTIYGSLVGGRCHSWMKREESHMKHFHPNTIIMEDKLHEDGHLRGMMKISDSAPGETRNASRSFLSRLSRQNTESVGSTSGSLLCSGFRQRSLSGPLVAGNREHLRNLPAPPVVAQGPIGPRKGKFLSILGC